MSTRDIGRFRNRLSEVLSTNQPLMPLLSQAARDGITIVFEPWVENNADMLVIRVSKQDDDNTTVGAQTLINSETLMTSVFYAGVKND